MKNNVLTPRPIFPSERLWPSITNESKKKKQTTKVQIVHDLSYKQSICSCMPEHLLHNGWLFCTCLNKNDIIPCANKHHQLQTVSQSTNHKVYSKTLLLSTNHCHHHSSYSFHSTFFCFHVPILLKTIWFSLMYL